MRLGERAARVRREWSVRATRWPAECARAAAFGMSDEAESARRGIDWLLRASLACGHRGFAVQYDMADGWAGPYVEVSGYILSTLRAACDSWRHRVEDASLAYGESVDWLLSVQAEDGSFGSPIDGRAAAFDTGQVLFGLADSAIRVPDERVIRAMRSAGKWMSRIQEPDGSWVRHAYRGIPHTYYARAAWGLALAGEVVGEPSFSDAARAQLAWAVAQQHADGWFDRCSFFADDRPVLHVIAYTIEGLWESAALLGEQRFADAALRAAEALARVHRENGVLQGAYAPGWVPATRWRCVTGLAQMALVWRRMSRAGAGDWWSEAAETLAFVRAHQLAIPRSEVLGGLPGSVPIHGGYFPWAVPSWGVKFYLDALMAGRHCA